MLEQIGREYAPIQPDAVSRIALKLSGKWCILRVLSLGIIGDNCSRHANPIAASARAILTGLLPIVAARTHCFVSRTVVISDSRHPEINLIELHRR